MNEPVLSVEVDTLVVVREVEGGGVKGQLSVVACAGGVWGTGRERECPCSSLTSPCCAGQTLP